MKSAILLFLFISGLSLPQSFAGNREVRDDQIACQDLLVDELGRIPNDLRQGLVTHHVPMNVESLQAAYSRGIFPWIELSNGKVEWYSPPNRGILDLQEVRIPRSDRKILERLLRDKTYEVTFDRDFEGVIRACAEIQRWTIDEFSKEKRPAGRWISPMFIEQYSRLHRAGLARSVEVWRDGRLVGGLYGVFVNGVYSGESMFHAEDNVSKLAFYSLIIRLRINGHRFIDTQQARRSDGQAVNLAVKWGAREIPREKFQQMLSESQKLNLEY